MQELLISFAATVAGIMTITEFLKNAFDTTGFVSQLLSWGVGLVIVMASWFLGLGWVAAYELWWEAAIWAVGVSLAANGVFETPLIQGIINAILRK